MFVDKSHCDEICFICHWKIRFQKLLESTFCFVSYMHIGSFEYSCDVMCFVTKGWQRSHICFCFLFCCLFNVNSLSCVSPWTYWLHKVKMNYCVRYFVYKLCLLYTDCAFPCLALTLQLTCV
jgi:hypothetical protein